MVQYQITSVKKFYSSSPRGSANGDDKTESLEKEKQELINWFCVDWSKRIWPKDIWPTKPLVDFKI
jgi:hypothetical protein